jgi:hypothetical protein
MEVGIGGAADLADANRSLERRTRQLFITRRTPAALLLGRRGRA